MALNRKELFRSAGWLGLVVLAAGGVRYSVEGVFSLVVKVCLGVGGALLVIAIIALHREIAKFFSRRSSKLGSNTIVIVLAFVVILGIPEFSGIQAPQAV